MDAVSEAPERNAKIQLLSVVCEKDVAGNYLYHQNKLIEKFHGVTLYDIKQARKYAAKDQAEMQVEPGHYC